MAQIEHNMILLQEMQLELMRRSAEQDKRMARFEERMSANDEPWIEMWKYFQGVKDKSDERFLRIEQLLMNLCVHLPEALQNKVGFQKEN